jgi:hypothetical protein
VNAEIINLRRVKKNVVRKQSEKNAEANRQKFGRTKREKTLTTANKTLAASKLAAHKREE